MSYPDGGIGFRNPVVGGDGELVVNDIHSRNFVAGSAGWRITRAGSAEFNDITVRGTAIARNGHKFIGFFPAQPDMEFNPDDTIYNPGTLSFIDVAGTGVETQLRTGYLFAGQTPPDIKLTSDASAQGTISLDSSTLSIAGDITYPNDTIGSWHYIEKASANTKFNNTFSNDPNLRFQMSATATYKFWLYLIISSASATADFKMQFTGPAGFDVTYVPDGLDPTVAVGTTEGIIRMPESSGARALAAVGTGTTATVALAQGRVKTTGTAGEFVLQWAQNTTDGANATQVMDKSHLLYQRVA